MKDRIIYLVAGVIAGGGVATLLVVTMMGDKPSPKTSSTSSTASGSASGTTETAGDQKQPTGAAAKNETEPPKSPPPEPKKQAKRPKKKKKGSTGGGPPGPGYVKTGEVTKTIDLSKGGEKGKSPRGPKQIEIGGSIEAQLGAPEDAPEGFEFQTNFHVFQAKKGQKLAITVEGNSKAETGIQPLIILWKPDKTGAPDKQIDFARAKKGESSVTLVHTFKEKSRYLISVDDARNVPIRKAKPDQYYGGPAFTYTASVEEPS